MSAGDAHFEPLARGFYLEGLLVDGADAIIGQPGQTDGIIIYDNEIGVWMQNISGNQQARLEGADVYDIAPTLLPVFPKTALENPSNPGVDILRQRNPIHIRAYHSRQRVRDIVALDRALSRPPLVDHRSERPDIRPLIDLLSLRLFGAHVRPRCRESLQPASRLE